MLKISSIKNLGKNRLVAGLVLLVAISLIGYASYKVISPTGQKSGEPSYLVQQPIVRAVSPAVESLAYGLLSQVGISVDPGQSGSHEGGTSENDQEKYNPNQFNATVQVWGVSGSGRSYQTLKNVNVEFSSKNRSGDRGCGKNGSFGNKWIDSSGPTNKNGEIKFVNCTKNNSRNSDLGYNISLSNVPSEWSQNRNRANREMKVIIVAPSDNNFHIDVVLPNRFELVAKPVNTLPSTLLKLNDRDRLNIFLEIQDKEEENRRKARLQECIKEEQSNNELKVRGYHSEHGGGKRLKSTGRPEKPGRSVKVIEVLDAQAFRNKHRNNLAKECESLRKARRYNIHVRAIDIHSQTRTIKRVSNVGVQLKFHGPGKCTYRSPTPHRPYVITNAQGIATFSRCSRNNIDIEFSNLGSLVSVNRPEFNKNSSVIVHSSEGPNGQTVDIFIQFTRAYPKTWRSKFNQAASEYWRYRLGRGGPAAEERRLGYPKGSLLGYHEARCQPYEVDMIFVDRNQSQFAHVDALRGAVYPPGSKLCRIHFNKDNSPFIKNKIADPETACLTFVHEYGHLLGYGENRRDRNDPMWFQPVVSDPYLQNRINNSRCGNLNSHPN